MFGSFFIGFVGGVFCTAAGLVVLVFQILLIARWVLSFLRRRHVLQYATWLKRLEYEDELASAIPSPSRCLEEVVPPSQTAEGVNRPPYEVRGFVWIQQQLPVDEKVVEKEKKQKGVSYDEEEDDGFTVVDNESRANAIFARIERSKSVPVEFYSSEKLKMRKKKEEEENKKSADDDDLDAMMKSMDDDHPVNFKSLVPPKTVAVTLNAFKFRIMFSRSLCVLRNNMLFVCTVEDTVNNEEEDEDEEPKWSARILLDDCAVSVLHVRKGKCSRRNIIRVTHPTRPLLGDCTHFYLWCLNGIEVERWYEALYRATHWAACMAAGNDMLEHQFTYFSSVVPIFKNMSESGDPQTGVLAALNALISRVWYGYHDNPTLKKFFVDTLDKVLAGVGRPAAISQLNVGDFSIGPHMPIVHGAKVHTLTETGETAVDCDFTYAGGLRFVIEVVIVVKLPFGDRRLKVHIDVDVAVTSCKGIARIILLPPPASRLWLSFVGQPDLDLRFDTRLHGYTNISVQSLAPSVASYVVDRVKAEIFSMFVYPQSECFALPFLASRKNAFRAAVASAMAEYRQKQYHERMGEISQIESDKKELEEKIEKEAKKAGKIKQNPEQHHIMKQANRSFSELDMDGMTFFNERLKKQAVLKKEKEKMDKKQKR